MRRRSVEKNTTVNVVRSGEKNKTISYTCLDAAGTFRVSAAEYGSTVSAAEARGTEDRTVDRPSGAWTNRRIKRRRQRRRWYMVFFLFKRPAINRDENTGSTTTVFGKKKSNDAGRAATGFSSAVTYCSLLPTHAYRPSCCARARRATVVGDRGNYRAQRETKKSQKLGRLRARRPCRVFTPGTRRSGRLITVGRTTNTETVSVTITWEIYFQRKKRYRQRWDGVMGEGGSISLSRSLRAHRNRHVKIVWPVRVCVRVSYENNASNHFFFRSFIHQSVA